MVVVQSLKIMMEFGGLFFCLLQKNVSLACISMLLPEDLSAILCLIVEILRGHWDNLTTAASVQWGLSNMQIHFFAS